MMGRHAAPDEPEVVETPKRKLLTERSLPHIAMAAVAIFYVFFYVLTGVASNNFSGASVPQTVSLAFTGTLATWFGYCIRERAANKGDK
jgi:hypothetical protein